MASKTDGFVAGEGADRVETDSEVFSLGNQTEDQLTLLIQDKHILLVWLFGGKVRQ